MVKVCYNTTMKTDKKFRTASIPTSLYLSTQMRAELRAAGMRYGLTMSGIIRMAIREWLDARKILVTVVDNESKNT